MRASPEPLCTQHDVALLDLDGVVYVGADAVPGIPAVIESAAAAGMRFGYVTNNASRAPHQVGDHLRDLGIAVTDDEVITSSQAAGRVLADRLPAGAPVLIIGTQALADEVERAGLRAVWSAQDGPRGVVQGYSPQLSWAMLAEACVAIRAGALWVATNTDSTLPTPRGTMPGNGSFVQIVAQTTGATPVVAGKPEPAMHAECVRRTRAERPLVVGDRLDTDIEGAVRAGVPSLLVLSGLAGPADLLAAAPGQRPTYLAPDLGGILLAQPGIERTGNSTRCGTWQVTERSGALVLSSMNGANRSGSGDDGDDGDDGQGGDGGDGGSEVRSQVPTEVDCAALRALAVLAWDLGVTRTVSADPAAAAVLARLGLPARRLASPLSGRYGRPAVVTGKGGTVVRQALGTVARIVQGAASDTVRGSRRAAEATGSFLRAHARDPLRLIGRPRRAPRGSESRPASPVSQPDPVLAVPPARTEKAAGAQKQAAPKRAAPAKKAPAPRKSAARKSAAAKKAATKTAPAPRKAAASKKVSAPRKAAATTGTSTTAAKAAREKAVANEAAVGKVAAEQAHPATPTGPRSETVEPATPSGQTRGTATDDQRP